ncbi:hypothetical protein Patl1_10432 [Pistacia atlantica]|uniref:Uncharacterized protein n=1 Tax=Pistacia atlantica TaxID=434234 RepID=A0ACC1A953_9ROSI|nr:hypothetical protein Patl1_10432 [Pistacia atlantica]
MEGGTDLESFAVVKTSFDPQKDFRDSMNEMIMEKKISQPEELEELLACYLTLNSDEYHDLIIKVFRQVVNSTKLATYNQGTLSLDASPQCSKDEAVPFSKPFLSQKSTAYSCGFHNLQHMATCRL